MADIVNVRTSGEDVIFDLAGVDGKQEVGFSTAGREAAAQIAALLPSRCTPDFDPAPHAEREVFTTASITGARRRR